jgi:hypothetical protein
MGIIKIFVHISSMLHVSPCSFLLIHLITTNEIKIWYFPIKIAENSLLTEVSAIFSE